MIIRSEFAAVEVEADYDEANGPRLKILDLQTGRTNYLDALELESLAWTSHEALEPLLNPSRSRWRDEETVTVDQE